MEKIEFSSCNSIANKIFILNFYHSTFYFVSYHFANKYKIVIGSVKTVLTH